MADRHQCDAHLLQNRNGWWKEPALNLAAAAISSYT